MRLRYDAEVGRMLDLNERRWFQWGMIKRGGVDEAWYWMLRLPSYVVKVPAHIDPRRGPAVWHQRCLFWVEPLKGNFEDWQGLKIREVELTP